MVVRDNRRSFEAFVSRDFGLFTGFAGFLYNEVLESAAVNGESFELVESFGFVLKGEFEDEFCQVDKALVFGYEVGFAVEGNDSGEVVFHVGEHATFGCVAVFAFGGNGLTFFAEDFYSGFHVAVSLVESVFAVAETGGGELAEFFDIFDCNCHGGVLFNFNSV